MHHWIVRSSSLVPTLAPLSKGIAAECPFCKARKHDIPAIGQRILFLVGGDVGEFGIRVDDSKLDLRLDQFVVKMDYETRGYLRNVTRFLDLFMVEPFSPVPNWMPRLSIQDALAIHESMLRGFLSLQERLPRQTKTFVYSIVSACWWQRLPVNGSDIWPMIEVHGLDKKKKTEFAALFDFGFELLVRSNGRKPIKRKLMPPLSKGRYLSKNDREIWLKHFGHNFGYDQTDTADATS